MAYVDLLDITKQYLRALDRPAVFHNPRAKAARYAVVIATHPAGR